MKKIKLHLSFLFLLYPFSLIYAQNCAPSSQWRAMGIGGGSGIYEIAINPNDPNSIFIVNDIGGVLRTTDRGENWEAISFTQLEGDYRGRIQFTSDPNVLYAIHVEYELDITALKKSVDGGRHWQYLDHIAGDLIYHLSANPNKRDELIIANDKSIFFSNDGGWSFVPFPISADLHVAGVVWDRDSIYVGTNKGVWQSKDRGFSFAPALFSISQDVLFDNKALLSFAGGRSGDKMLFYGISREGEVKNGITSDDYWGLQEVLRFEKEDNEDRIQMIGVSTAINGYPFFVRTPAADPSIVYIAGSSNSETPLVFKSTNAGRSWRNIFQTNGNNNIQTGYAGSNGDLPYDWSWNATALAFAVNSADPDQIMVSDYSFAHISDDGGESWRAVYVRPEDLNPKGEPIEQGRFYRSNGFENTTVWHLNFISGQKLFAGYTDITGAYSEDGGNSWRINLPGNNFNTTYHTVLHSETGVLYAAVSSLHDIYQTTTKDYNMTDGADGEVLLSHDGGLNWETMHDFGAPVIWLALDPNDAEVMYASVVNREFGGIYRTKNLSAGRRAQWEYLGYPPEASGHAYNVHVLNDGMVLTTFSVYSDQFDNFQPRSGVFIWSESNSSWINKSAPLMEYWTKDVVVDPHDPTQNTWLVGVFRGWNLGDNDIYGGLYRTRNRGESWQKIGRFSKWIESAAFHPDDPDLLYVTTENDGLWVSCNARAEEPAFELVDEYPFLHPMRVFFNPFNTCETWATSFGNGIKMLSRSPVGAPASPKDVSKNFMSAVAFPNPADDLLNIELSDFRGTSKILGEWQIQFYDLTGRKVRQFGLNKHISQIDVSSFEKGVYVYRIYDGRGDFITGKITIQ